MSAQITLRILEGPDPQRDEDGWEHNAYTVELRRGTRRMSVPWKAGMGIEGPPTAADVLECLLSDAASVENAAGDFEEWAPELGYDPDSRRALAVFEALTKQTAKLRRFLGEDFERAVFPPFDDSQPYRDPSDVARDLCAQEA